MLPEIRLESQIEKKIAQGQTKEQAIEELYAKIKSRVEKDELDE